MRLLLSAVVALLAVGCSSGAGPVVSGGEADGRNGTPVTIRATAPIAEPGPTMPTSARSQTDPSSPARIGSAAPDFTLPTLQADSVSLSGLRGKTVLVNFWASWCGPCRDEMPALQALQTGRRADNLVVVAINWGEDADTARRFAVQLGLTYTIALDVDQAVGRRYLTYALPVSYWIDRQGAVVDRVVGAMTPEVMSAKADRALAAAPSTTPRSLSVSGVASREELQQVVAAIGGAPLFRGADLDQRLDVVLAIDRLTTGRVLDPARPADQAEIADRRTYALGNLIDEFLLVDAADRAQVSAPEAEVEAEVARLSTAAGGASDLPRELAAHGVTPADVRQVFTRGAIARTFIDEHVLSAQTVGPPDQAVRAWLDAERVRRTVVSTVPADEPNRSGGTADEPAVPEH